MERFLALLGMTGSEGVEMTELAIIQSSQSVCHIIPADEEQIAEFCEASREIRTVPRK
jgi:hypothetical protein